ncbi:ABC transporter ATP-binding protein [Pseudoroseicyclus aestuarii]|uniref:Iron complex transport system ATP-binding protein n=1 Tax=Pseudoroseicyclus aestuarii TaxID=1795041 RepID=A0A318ST35_9RHOB|nr:ABC transporter ATP-binding protein [Pseudoroseicyclus aestuarii]PYE82329.1 iron complex transport system ATP-binding protein [Pseudoroseicyclus aestuarii]
MTSRLEARALSLAYQGRTIVQELSLAIPDGQVTAIIGPNACGKSTLLRALARILKPAGGAVLLDGRAIAEQPTRSVARSLGLLPQTPLAPEGIAVADLVARGRAPHQGMLRQWSRADEAAVSEALEATGAAPLAGKRIEELSGGQRQRVWIAMALAQETDLLLLDEPTTYLDLRHQIEVLALIRRLNREKGRTIVMVLHDIGLAGRYADHLVAMAEGRVLAEGPPEAVVTPEILRRAFGLEARVIPDPETGTPLVVPRATP